MKLIAILAPILLSACDPGACFDVPAQRIEVACVDGVAYLPIETTASAPLTDLALDIAVDGGMVDVADGGVSVACSGPVVFVGVCH